MAQLLDSLFAQTEGSSLADLAAILAEVATALRLRDARPAALVAAAGVAAAAAQRVQDEEETAFDAGAQVAAQLAAARCAVGALEELAAALDAAAEDLADEARAHTDAAAAKQERIRKYKEQQRQIAARLEALGYCPEIGQAHLQARGRERGQALTELARVEAELQQYRGLPTDVVVARAATLEKRQELDRLRRRLKENLEAMA